MEKEFVSVSCMHSPDGTVRPMQLFWKDGRAWDIRKVIHVAGPAEDEYEGIRYTVLIGSAEKKLYRTGSRWYVEPVHTEVDSS